MKKGHHCTCKDLDCKMHPKNHDKGCDPCITSNLKDGEIPSCFFASVSEEMDELNTYKFRDFVDFYRLHNPDQQTDTIPNDDE